MPACQHIASYTQSIIKIEVSWGHWEAEELLVAVDETLWGKMMPKNWALVRRAYLKFFSFSSLQIGSKEERRYKEIYFVLNTFIHGIKYPHLDYCVEEKPESEFNC